MTSRSEHRRAGGFTLIEMLVVPAILGLTIGLVVMRGPTRVRSVDLRATAEAVADNLRLARAQAIAGNRAIGVVFDAENRLMEGPGPAGRTFAPELAVALFSLAGSAEGTRLVIGFNPDGSSSGGAVILANGARRMRVDVTWLSGQVRLTDVP